MGVSRGFVLFFKKLFACSSCCSAPYSKLDTVIETIVEALLRHWAAFAYLLSGKDRSACRVFWEEPLCR